MLTRDRALKATFICLPFLAAYLVTQFFLTGIRVYDAKTSLGLFFFLPLILVSLPWSFGVVAIEELLKNSYPLAIINQINVAVAFAGYWLNSFLLLRKFSFRALLVWGCIIPVLLLLAFVNS